MITETPAIDWGSDQLRIPELSPELHERLAGRFESIPRLATAAIEASLASDTIPDGEPLRPGYPVIANEILDTAVENNILTAKERKILEIAAPKVAQLLRKPGVDGRTAFSDICLSVSMAANAQGRTKKRDFEVIDRDVRAFFALTDTLSVQNRHLLDEAKVAEATEKTTTSADLLVDEATAGQVELDHTYDDNSAPVLTTMALVDLMTFVRNIDEATLTKLRTTVLDDDNLENIEFTKRDYLLYDLLEVVNEPTKVWGRRVAQIFEKTYKFLGGRAKGAHKAAAERVGSVMRTFGKIERFDTANDVLIAHKNVLELEPQVTVRETSSSAFEALASAIDDCGHITDEYYYDEPDKKKLLESLAIETWIVEVMIAYLEGSGSISTKTEADDMRKEKRIHKALNYIILQEQLEELEATISPLEQERKKIEANHVISSQLIRRLPGGMQLRRRIEDWHEAGSQRTLFTQDEAQALAGWAINVAETDSGEAFKQDVMRLRRIRSDLALLGQHANTKDMIRRIDTLVELYESASDKELADEALLPLWNLARLLVNEELVSEPEKPDLQNEATSPEPDEDTESTNAEPHWHSTAEFTHTEFIKAFPPEASGEDALRQDLQEMIERKEYTGDPVEWERITRLVELRDQLTKAGFTVDTLRLMQSAWHPLPHYVLEAVSPVSGSIIAVVESPVYSNATYVVADEDWRSIVEFSKPDARKLGATPKVHSASLTLADHRNKLFTVLQAHA